MLVSTAREEKKKPITQEIAPIRQERCLKEFINGKRNMKTVWCDWSIPLHWGATSDPFQVCELEHRESLKALKIFANTKYPFIVSTKNPGLLTEEPYLSIVKKCRCVLQISMACSKYDKLEPGAPSYEKRLEAAAILAPHVTRIIARPQPYFTDCLDDILKEIPRWAKAGIYGVSTAGYVTRKQQPGLQREGKKYRFAIETLAEDFKRIRTVCHENGLKVFFGEDGLAFLGDDLTCCGTMGLDDYIPNKYNLQRLAYENVEPTEAMQKPHTADAFVTLRQSLPWKRYLYTKSFADMIDEYKDSYIVWVRKMQKLFGD